MEFTDFISDALCIKVKASEHITLATREAIQPSRVEMQL